LTKEQARKGASARKFPGIAGRISGWCLVGVEGIETKAALVDSLFGLDLRFGFH
jgi:hypothetical protein